MPAFPSFFLPASFRSYSRCGAGPARCRRYTPCGDVSDVYGGFRLLEALPAGRLRYTLWCRLSRQVPALQLLRPLCFVWDVWVLCVSSASFASSAVNLWFWTLVDDRRA